MGYTITEKILAAHTGKRSVVPGEFISAKLDLCLGNDITAPLAIKAFEEIGAKKVFDKTKIALIPDHFTPNKDLKSANQCKILSEFAHRHDIKFYFEVGRMGIEHALLPELGIVLPGDLVIGADSHTCTYGALGAFSTGVGSTDLAAAFATGRCWFRVPESMKFVYKGRLPKWTSGKDLILYTIGKIGVDGALYKAMEFGGYAIRTLDVDSRFSMCNMAIEAGAKSGIIEPDDITIEYIRERWKKAYAKSNRRKYTIYKSDGDARYAEVHEYDISRLEPQVSTPHLPSNSKDVGRLSKVAIDQVVIGSCTNGRLSDLEIAARVLKGKKVNSRVRTIVIPATQNIYIDALKLGYLEIFLDAGAIVSTPTCGPCLGGHMGILGAGEVAIATTNRNFKGRMGDLTSEVYLSNPAVAAASAIKGRIAHPAEVTA
ncbi:MAG: 3-isopropylmalate dehydratase large subunit [Candidatus Omnitrophica bacterium]|nr:3-isopropylmalate dehydratase large subunit [Candidatus Omnitrophota bacterium]